jgi:hypothetical protein
MKNFPTLMYYACVKMYRENLPNSAEELRQRIRNSVASLTIKELRYRVELGAKNGGELVE